MRRNKSVFVRGTWDVVRVLATTVIFTALVVGMIIYALHNTSRASSDRGLRNLEDGIRRAVIAAYSIEGRYPHSISHIEEKYGVFIDRTRYIVHYMPYGKNIMPKIIVIELDS